MTTALEQPLDVTDRCDQCNAQAYIRAVLSGGGELLFCAHHGRRHEPKLRPNTSEWEDHTHLLTEQDAVDVDD